MEAQTWKKWGPEGWGIEGWGIEGCGTEGWGPGGWRAEGWRAEGWWAQNFALFSSPAPIFALFVSLWVFSCGILVVFEASGPFKCACLEFSVVVSPTPTPTPTQHKNGSAKNGLAQIGLAKLHFFGWSFKTLGRTGLVFRCSLSCRCAFGRRPTLRRRVGDQVYNSCFEGQSCVCVVCFWSLVPQEKGL